MERVRQGHSQGIKKYQQVLSFAASKQIPLRLAEVHVQAILRQDSALEELRDARYKRRLNSKANVLMIKLGISMENAMQLLVQAKSGDEAVRERIRQARQLQPSDRAHLSAPQVNSSATETKSIGAPVSLFQGNATDPLDASAMRTEHAQVPHIADSNMILRKDEEAKS